MVSYDLFFHECLCLRGCFHVSNIMIEFPFYNPPPPSIFLVDERYLNISILVNQLSLWVGDRNEECQERLTL